MTGPPHGTGNSMASPSSLPSTSQSSRSLSCNWQPGGVQTTCAQIHQKLGFVSPVYSNKETRGQSTQHGIIGSIGYTSSSHVTLAPAVQFGPYASQAWAQGGSRGHSNTTHVVKYGPLRPRTLTQGDIEYLRENSERNEEVFCQWSRAKSAEQAKRRVAAAEREEDINRFLDKEAQQKDECAKRVLEWQVQKVLQKKADAMHRRQRQQELRKMDVHNKMRSALERSSNRSREGRFQLVTNPAHLPTRLGFDATLSGYHHS